MHMTYSLNQTLRLMNKSANTNIDRFLVVRYCFYKEYSSFVVGECSAGALDLARAEQFLYNPANGFKAVWEHDEDGLYDHDDWCTIKDEHEHEVYSCAIIDTHTDECVAALSGIVDPGYKYKRVIEAELMAEYKYELTHRDVQPQQGTKFHAPLGSISEGTLNPTDLIPRYIDTLTCLIDDRSLSPHAEHTKQDYGRLTALMGLIEERMAQPNYHNTDAAMWDMESLADELDVFAPPGAYFGSNEGDGASIGFWNH